MGTVDLWVCESMARDDSGCSREQSYQAALLLDLMKDGWNSESRTIKFEDYENVQGFCATPVLPPMTAKALEISFLEPLSTIKDPLARMLGKGQNQKCMIRMCNERSVSVFSENKEILVTVRLWTLCSLLGNYVHAKPSSRPDMKARQILYDWLWGYDVGADGVETSPFLRLQELCPHLVLFACREQLVHLLGDIPALQRHFDTFSNFALYRDIVTECMDEIRHWFSTHLRLPCSPIHDFLSGKNAGSESEKEFFRVIKEILLCYHTRLGDINYRRPNSNVMSVIRSLKSGKKKDVISMIPMPCGEKKNTSGTGIGIMDALTEELYDGEEEETKTSNKKEDTQRSTSFDFSDYLPQSHIKAVGDMIEALLNKSMTPSQAFYCCLDVFDACGLTRDQVQVIKSVIKSLQTGRVSKKHYEGQFRVLQRLMPHGYNLIQAAAELVREKQRVRIICTLPWDITQKQLQAAQSRFGCTGTDYLSDSLCFYFCPVCDCIYSLVRDFNASFANNYQYGLRDAAIDYITRLPYCRRGKKNHRGECGAEPLSCIPLAGILLFYCNKRIMLCPQEGCGMAMVIDSKKSIVNETGPVRKALFL